MDRFLEKMMRLPLDVLISSMESMTRTMHEIQERAESPPEGRKDDDEGALGNAPRLALTPLFEMYKVPTSGLVSGFDTFSRAMEDARKSPEEDPGESGGEPAPTLDPEVVELDAGEAELAREAELPGGVDAVAGTTLWQIGRPGRADHTGPWRESFDYRVGEDLDPHDAPAMPHMLVAAGGPQAAGGTGRLNVRFHVERDHAAGALALRYDRWGGEKDRVYLDEQLLAPVAGAGRGRMRQVVLRLGALSAGDHVIGITTSGETTERAHRIDCLGLSEIASAEQ